MDTLFKTTEELKLYIKVWKSLDIATMESFIDEAQQSFMQDILGADLLDELQAAYSAASLSIENRKLITDNVMDADLFSLLPYVQKPLAKLALAVGGDRLAISLGETGFKTTQDASTAPPTSGQIWHYIEGYLTAGYNDLERLIAYLQANTPLSYSGDNPTAFEQWKESSEYAETLDYFINTAKQFSGYYPKLNKSRRIYTAMKGCMKKIEEFVLKSELGETFFAEIKAEIAAENIDTDTEEILLLIRPAVAHLTVAKALKEMVADISASGLFINSIKSTSGRDVSIAPNSLLKMSIDEAEKDGNTYLRKLKDYLNTYASAEKFKTYFDSDLYISIATDEQPAIFKNNEDNKYFASL